MPVKDFKKRYTDAAYAVALSSEGVGGRTHSNFKIGSILVLGASVVSAVNSYKTSPRLVQFYKYPFFHAEAACIFKMGIDKCENGILYVARVKRDGSLGLARPCEECQKLIALVKLKKVVYSTENGYEVL